MMSRAAGYTFEIKQLRGFAQVELNFNLLFVVAEASAAAKVFRCPYCNDPDEYSAPSEHLFLTHVRMVHLLDPNFSIQCDSVGCARTFRNFRTYQNHRNSHHKSTSDSPQEVSEVDFQLDDIPLPELDQLSPPSEIDMQSYAAKWILRTSEKRNLTRSASLGIVEDVSTLVEFTVETLQAQVRRLLSENGINSTVIMSRLNEVFTSPITKPFDGISSFYQQLQHFEKHFNLVVSQHTLCVK